MKTPAAAEALLQLKELFGDLLKEAPKKVKGKEKKTPTLLSPERNLRYWSPTFIRYSIIKQECTTCGNIVEFAATRRVVLQSKLNSSFKQEITTLLPYPLELPDDVELLYETTDFCPSCLRIAQLAEISLHAVRKERTGQMELFQ